MTNNEMEILCNINNMLRNGYHALDTKTVQCAIDNLYNFLSSCDFKTHEERTTEAINSELEPISSRVNNLCAIVDSLAPLETRLEAAQTLEALIQRQRKLMHFLCD